MKQNWEHYSHTADMGIRGFGATMEEAFAAAALAMTAISVDPETIQQNEKVEIVCESACGGDYDLLFIDWLNSIIYEMATGEMVFGRFEVHIEGDRLTGKAWGEKLDLSRHDPGAEIKGTSYSDLEVLQKDGKWMAQCIIDI